MITLKLKISEDTACIASKTSYMDEDGLDKNGIYYFGDKPNLPTNWKDAFKKKKNKQIKEGVNGNMITQYIEVDSKQVKDSGGWLTDYTMYMRIETTRDNWLAFLQSDDVQHGNIDIPEDWITGYVFVFGDSDIYGPEDEDFDWECDTEEEAYEWFSNYSGFDDEDEFDWDLDESLNESVIDDSGMFMQMDDAMEGLIGNVSDSDIDEVVRYYSTISGKLGKKDKYSSIYCYFSNESWLDPLENRSDFDLTPMYKNGKYDAHICNSKYGKFIVDHFSNNFDFTMYATDESIIDNVLKDIELKYE